MIMTIIYNDVVIPYTIKSAFPMPSIDNSCVDIANICCGGMEEKILHVRHSRLLQVLHLCTTYATTGSMHSYSSRRKGIRNSEFVFAIP